MNTVLLEPTVSTVMAASCSGGSFFSAGPEFLSCSELMEGWMELNPEQSQRKPAGDSTSELQREPIQPNQSPPKLNQIVSLRKVLFHLLLRLFIPASPDMDTRESKRRERLRSDPPPISIT